MTSFVPRTRRRPRSRQLAAFALAAAALATATPCAAQAEEPRERAAEVGKGRSIAVLPLLNRTGKPAPLAEIRDDLAAGLAERGLSILDRDELERFMRRHRLRYTGGLNGEMAAALEAETGARAALVTSLDLHEDTDPPKLGITSRLVSAAAVPRILWMDSQAISGDESPGLLGLRLVDDPAVIRRRVIARLADSLVGAAAGAARAEAARGSREERAPKRFRPKIAYAARDGGIREAVRGRIAVLPLDNESTTRYAGEILTDQLVRHLVRSGARVVEPGVVRHALLEARQIQPEGPSVPEMDVLRAALGADLVLYGEVAHYQEAGGGTPQPVLGFSLRAIATATRQVVWSSVSHTKGNDGVFFFDIGEIATAHRLSSELSRAIVVALAKTDQEGGAGETGDDDETAAEELAILAGDPDVLTRLLDAARSARDGLAEQLAAARHEAAQARAEAEKLRARLAAGQEAGSDSEGRLGALAAERDALLAKLSEADRRQEQLEDSIDSLERALADARGRPLEAEAALTASEAEKASLGEQLAAARAREAELEGELQTLRTGLAEARRGTAEAEARLAAAEAERSSLAQRIAAAEARTATVEDSLRALETDLAETRRQGEAALAEARQQTEAILAEARRQGEAALAESREREAALQTRLQVASRITDVAPVPATTTAQADPAAVEAAVRSWADAWSGQRPSDYLARYSSAFRPPDGLSREAWESQRRERLARPAFIELTLESLRIEILEPDRARASFRQTYRSDTYADVVTKTLDLGRDGGEWTILRERAQ